MTSSIKQWFVHAWRRLLSWLQQNARLASDDTYVIVYANDDPEKVGPRSICVVGESGYTWHAMLRCPCGCGETISLNLLRDDHPCWVLIDHGGLVSLSPSIRRTSGCRSHFFIRDGRVDWCEHQEQIRRRAN